MASAYNSGMKAFQSCYSNNPYRSEPARSEWQNGYDAARESDEHMKNLKDERWNSLWNVPEKARDEYISMEDKFSPKTVLEFILAMIEKEED